MSFKLGNSSLTRRKPLKRSPMRRRPKHHVETPAEVGREEFKRIRDGLCKVCGAHGLVCRHHIVTERHVRQEGGDPWDLRNGLWIGLGGEAGELRTCDCHRQHHDAFKRISIERIPAVAFEFAAEVLGEARARDYFRRWYDESVVS